MATVPNNERRLAADSNGPVQAVSKLLVKQARLTHVRSSGSLCDSASCITSGAATPIPRPNAGVEDCLELCRLLLEKVGADAHTDNSSELDRVLKTEYPPRVAELLGRITDTLDTNRILDSISDVTDSSDDETIPESPGTCDKISSVDFLLKTSEEKKPLQPTTPKSDVAYKSDTEIAIGRIFTLGKFKAVQDASIPANAPYNGPSLVTMTGFGELGRYGNQLLQYAFLRCYASLHNIAEIQVPAWVGSGLFGLHNRPVMRALPPVVEFEGTLANSTFTDDLIRYVKSSDTSKEIEELNNRCLANENAGSAPKNVDIWGWFQWHSSAYRPFKALIRDTFRPVPAIESHLRSVFNKEVRFRGGRKRTVVGLHLRYGDYQNIAASSFGYCAPTSWYLEWLDKHWQTFEDPVLIVASDDLKAVLRDFAKYSPLTTDSIGMTMPEEFQYLKAGFFPDWYSLTQCDVLAISNSTFSFTASMMNSRPHLKVYRAHYALKMTEVDPWNAEPIIHRDTSKSGVSQAVETLQILYNTQGASAVLRNVIYELPLYGIRSLIMKAVLWQQARNTAVVEN